VLHLIGSVEERAYLAGILDGEGTFVIRRGVDKKTGRIYFQAIVRVVNTSRDLIAWLRETFGGNVVRVQDRRPNHKPYWHWTLDGGPRVASVIRQSLPYLRVKRPQAEVLLEFYDHLERRGRNLSDAEWWRRSDLRDRLQILNKKGVA